MSQRSLYASLRRKLHPRRFSHMSSKMAAIVGFILKVQWTEPEIVDLAVTSDGHILSRNAGEIGFNMFFGSLRDLQRNWDTLLEAAELDEQEWALAQRLYARALGGRRRR